jgi:type I restriction enzyme M protein
VTLSTTIKSIQDIMRKDAGVDGDAQRIGQLGWMLFFKIFSDLEIETELEDDFYVSPVPPHLRWDAWANEDLVGTDAPTGKDLLDLVDSALFPAFKDLDLSEFTGKARQRAELLRSVFEDAYNYMKSGTLMRQVINRISRDIDFNQSKTRHLFGDIYEQILRDLQSAGNAGEFYTPRAATQFAVDMVAPRLGQRVLDPAVMRNMGVSRDVQIGTTALCDRRLTAKRRPRRLLSGGEGEERGPDLRCYCHGHVHDGVVVQR